MRQLFALKESTANKISYFHLVAFLVCLPFDRFFSQLILASFLIHTLIHTNKEKFRMILSWQNLVLSSVFLINLFGLIYSPEKLQADRGGEIMIDKTQTKKGSNRKLIIPEYI